MTKIHHFFVFLILSFYSISSFATLSSAIPTNLASLGLDQIIQEDGRITDDMVELLGWTGIRIDHSSVKPNPHWPKAKYTLKSRTLEDVMPAVQGQILPEISWRPVVTSKQARPLERWEMQKEFTPEQARHIVRLSHKILQLNSPITPQHRIYKGTLFLGSTLKSVRQRLRYLNGVVISGTSQITPITILTGERKLSPEVGEKPEDLVNNNNGIIPVHPSWQCPSQLPKDEGGMMNLVFEQSCHPSLSLDQIITVYTPKKPSEARATTESTLQKWLETSPKGGCYLVISNQPYVLYQYLVIQRCLLKAGRLDIQIEAVGPSSDSSSSSSDSLEHQATVLLDNFARIFYELYQIKKEVLKKGIPLDLRLAK